MKMSVEIALELFVEELEEIFRHRSRRSGHFNARSRQWVRELKEQCNNTLNEPNSSLNGWNKYLTTERAVGRENLQWQKGLLEEATEHKDEIEPGPVLNAALIGRSSG